MIGTGAISNLHARAYRNIGYQITVCTDVMEEDHATGKHRVVFMQGPVFTNFLLADEINRTPPKTQAALLQAMQEGEVSAGRETYKLKPPFFVVATQNPIEMEGTYPLPEAQLDRFMFNVVIDYPSKIEEHGILTLTTGDTEPAITPVATAANIEAMRHLVRDVPAASNVIDYALRIVRASRPAGDAADGLRSSSSLRHHPCFLRIADPCPEDERGFADPTRHLRFFEDSGSGPSGLSTKSWWPCHDSLHRLPLSC